MSVPLMLGGVEFLLHAGAPELNEDAIGGEGDVRLSNGTLVSMTRWSKASGAISVQGWIQPGIDALDFTQIMELRSTQVHTAQGAGLVFELTSTPRPDQAPWAWAVVDGELVPAEVSTVGRTATVTAVAGATSYQVWWMPVYQVKARRPSKSQSGSAGTQAAVISWVEA
ncbi:hypothetical protein [Pseudomonas sp. NPDC079086]|uniref:hypothetical protein n=1 Tax=unclassified Pseudomonas TaxID=196821 RepID=UPI0037C8859D